MIGTKVGFGGGLTIWQNSLPNKNYSKNARVFFVFFYFVWLLHFAFRSSARSEITSGFQCSLLN